MMLKTHSKMTHRLATQVVMHVILWSSFFLPSVLSGQEFEIGDTVEFERAGQKKTGEISDVLAGGKIVKIKYVDGPRTETFAQPVTRIRKVSGSSTGNPKPTGGAPVGSLGSVPGATGGDTFRFWTDQSGKFKVKAKLSERVDDKVRLETEDGRLITVAVEKLSDFDQAFLSKRKGAESENPFAGGEKIVKGESGSTAGGSGVAINTVVPNPTAGKKVILLSTGVWNLQPDAEELNGNLSPQAVQYGDGGFEKAFFDKPGNFVISPDESVAAMTITNAFGGNRTAVQFFDLENGKQLSSIGVPVKEARLVGMVLDPPTFATTRREWFKDKGRVDFWDGSDGLKHVIGWEGNYKSAKLVNDDHLLTIDHKGQAVLWDWRKGQSVYYFDCQAQVLPALSANRQQLAVGVATGIMIIDVRSGKPLGTLSNRKPVTMIAFSRDGTKLASIQNGNLAIWDLETGELMDEFALNGITPSNPSLQWADREHLLVNGSALVNYRLRVPVWEYKRVNGSMPLSGGRGGRFWYSAKTEAGGGVLIPVEIPQQDVQRVIEVYDPEDFLVIKPEMKVAIRMDLPFSQEDQKKVYDSLAAKLKANGCTVDPSSSIVLNCFTEKGKTQTREYENRGGFGRRPGNGSEKVTFTPTICYMQIAKSNKVLWKRSVSSGPGFMMFLNEGESIQQAANKQSKPSPHFYTSAEIPKYYATLPDGKKALGSNELTQNGIR